MNVAEIVTSRIIEAMQKDGIAPWHKPWATSLFRNAVSKKAYRGVNVLMLSLFGKDEFYMTANQIREHGGFIKRGTKAVPIVFYTKTDEKRDGSGNVTKPSFYMLRYYNVFGLSETENVKIKLPETRKIDFVPIDEAEKLVAASGAVIEYAGDRACYIPSEHKIRMPLKEKFESVEAYYAVLFHELTHWALSEVNKDASHDTNFGSDSYSKEELTAEIGANFLLSYCGIDASKTFDNSVAYLDNWASKLGKEPKLIISASSQANKRFDLLVNRLNPEAGQVETPETENVEMVAA